ncbi:hypothetical protein CHUAL_005202 [Chamberlinius hualienensis]
MRYIKFIVVTLCFAGTLYQLNSTCVRSDAAKKAFGECWEEVGVKHLLENLKDNLTEKENIVAIEVFKQLAGCAAVKMGYIDQNGQFTEHIIELINSTIVADDKTADTVYLENMKCFKKYSNNTKSGPINTLYCCGDIWSKNSTCVRSDAALEAFHACWNESGLNYLKNHEGEYTNNEIAVAIEIQKRVAGCIFVQLGIIDQNCKFHESIIELINSTIVADDKTADTIYLENMKCFQKYPNNTKAGTLKIVYCCGEIWNKYCPTTI